MKERWLRLLNRGDLDSARKPPDNIDAAQYPQMAKQIMATHFDFSRSTTFPERCLAFARRLLLMLVACPASAALAEGQLAGTCVEVEIGGERAISTECLNARLQPHSSRNAVDSRLNLSDRIDFVPPNQLGLFNRAALSNRMGDNFGKSAQPQRPVDAPRPAPLSKSR